MTKITKYSIMIILCIIPVLWIALVALIMGGPKMAVEFLRQNGLVK